MGSTVTPYASRNETVGSPSKVLRKRAKKMKPTLVLNNDRLDISSVRFNDTYLVAGTSLPDSSLEDIQNLMIEKTIGVWRCEALESARSLGASRHSPGLICV